VTCLFADIRGTKGYLVFSLKLLEKLKGARLARWWQQIFSIKKAGSVWKKKELADHR